MDEGLASFGVLFTAIPRKISFRVGHPLSLSYQLELRLVTARSHD